MTSKFSAAPRNTRKQRHTRNVPRACDSCRTKKTRCSTSDGSTDPPCSTCVDLGVECTYIGVAPKKYDRRRAYVQHLEERIAKLEKAFHAFNPGVNISKALDAQDEVDRDENESRGIPSIPISLLQRAVSTTPSNEAGENEWDGAALLPTYSNPGGLHPNLLGYHGNTGIGSFVMAVFKYEPAAWGVLESTISGIFEAWKPDPWEASLLNERDTASDLPPKDLIEALVNHYFTGINNYWPLLNRKIMQKDIAEQKYMVDAGFKTTLLLVCAIAAKSSQDPRVFAVPGQTHSRGWQWFHRAYASRPSLIEPSALDAIHFYALSALFLLGTSLPRSSWTLISFGIKVAQNLGIHRRYAYKHPWSANDELWKRAFWVLVSLDRMVSIIIGRPCTVQDEDFDLNFPVECDDEYWDPDNLDKPLRQPQDKPSIIAYFNSYIRLQQIIAVASRTIYCNNRSKIILGFTGPHWEQKIVSELDSALNQWLESGVPEHLRWDPNRPPGLFFNQSLALHVCYNSARILVHRPFINHDLAGPSLSICTSSARACINLVWSGRPFQEPAVMLLVDTPLFNAGATLLINFLEAGSRLQSPESKDLDLVEKCVEIIATFKQTWKFAGITSDFLRFLSSTIRQHAQTKKGLQQADMVAEVAPHLSQEEGQRSIASNFFPFSNFGASVVPNPSFIGLPIDPSFWYPGIDTGPPTFSGDELNFTAGLRFGGDSSFDFLSPGGPPSYSGNWAQYMSSLLPIPNFPLSSDQPSHDSIPHASPSLSSPGTGTSISSEHYAFSNPNPSIQPMWPGQDVQPDS